MRRGLPCADSQALLDLPLFFSTFGPARLRVPVACPRCSAVLFCGAECRDVAERTHHGVECGVLPLLWGSGASITCLMALRAISQLPKGGESESGRSGQVCPDAD